MELPTLATYLKQALTLILLLSLPVVITVGLVGLLVAFVQAITQVQDQTIAYGIKLITAAVVIAVSASWLGNELLTFADTLFAAIVRA
jgi:type III secretion protein S